MRFWAFVCTVFMLTINLLGLPVVLYTQEDQETLAIPVVPKGENEGLLVAEIEKREDSVTDKWMYLSLPIRLGIVVAIVIAQAVLIRLSGYLFKQLQKKLEVYGHTHFKPLTIKRYRLLETDQMLKMAFFLLRIVHGVVVIFQLYLTLPLIFSFFEPTKHLASTLFGYILNPLQSTVLNIINYIPSLITIFVIIIIARYALRGIKFFTLQIERGKLVIPGFYSDWAEPTFNILRVLLYTFTIIVIYPNLPNSDSAVFQGVSVFMGIMFSLGSSSIIGNLVAGIVITYMRPFTIGDRIKLNDIIGFVVEKTATVTRIRTNKNEFVTIPNMTVLTSSITNYHFSAAEKEEGLILHADVTMGYAVPWTTVHQILLDAAAKTTHVLETPKPYVLQTALDDYYARYEINVYTKTVDKIPRIYSELYQNLQDGFKAAHIDLTAPSYTIRLPAESEVNPGSTPS
ncbi:MAG: mechanosensitive ion channel family protein [Treponema sp.]|jgi:small-conductance mechanosensitive channel|nr:mechanosensitive ion channel family protein [Treponema sp.]